jgi:RNA polymerase-binding transcription factor DksA
MLSPVSGSEKRRHRTIGADAAVARNVLLALRSYLCQEAELLADAAHDAAVAARARSAPRRRASPAVFADVESFSRDLLRRKERTIERIDLALERLEDGTYGVCLACKSPIPASWLAKVPYTTLCESCQLERLAWRQDSCAV